ncbi:ABC transporter permease subunit [Flavihumibacter sp. R14]|nr:ABC transporter permease subunit [Flavihumibacter soli]
MNDQQSLWSFILEQQDKLAEQTLTHIGLTFVSLLIAVLAGIPLGILISRKVKWSGPILGFAGILQTIPSIALLGVMIPLLGIGPKPAIVALFLYALLPIIRNTYTGIREVDKSVIDAARGMGMSEWQILLKVELPLAMPVILAGIRTATVINVGVATLAAYIAAGGLGEFIFGGIALNNSNMILAGAIPAALLAILFDYLLSRLQKLNVRKLKPALLPLAVLLLVFSSLYIAPSVKAGSLLAGFTPEFMGRQDGYLGLREKYNLDIRTVVISDAVMYKAAFEKDLDVISGYSTDGRLKAFDLVVLHDDKGIFPPYYAAPIIKKSALEKFPELQPVLNLLAGRINDSIMTDLNYRVDYLKQSPGKVAKEFLERNGLYKQPRQAGSDAVRIGSKIFGEQYILANMYSMLIRGNTDLGVESKTGLGGTKICFDALINDQIDLYPEYSGTGLLVILQTPPKIVAGLKTKEEVFTYVKEEFSKKFLIDWLEPIGFNNAYALMMRRKQSEALRVKNISDLANYIKTH